MRTERPLEYLMMVNPIVWDGFQCTIVITSGDTDTQRTREETTEQVLMTWNVSERRYTVILEELEPFGTRSQDFVLEK